MIRRGASRWFCNVSTYGGEVIICEDFFQSKCISIKTKIL
jgi:hypothetical protein